MAGTSAGLLVHRSARGDAVERTEVLLVHPGGPFWAKKDLGAWSIPKGEHGPDDDPHDTAEREFAEELGASAPEPPADEPDIELGVVRQAGGKVVRCWARSGSLDVSAITSNTFELEWPPRSGQMATFPEVDRAAWFALDEARLRINPAQAALLDRLAEALEHRGRR